MRCFQLTNGDITLGLGNRAAFVTGTDKLLQDLQLWMLEPYGTGPSTPSFGSQLASFIGSADAAQQMAQVYAEATRILSIYQAFQLQRLKQAQQSGNLGNWSRSEILNEIVSVTVSNTTSLVNVAAIVNTLSQTNASVPFYLSVANTPTT